MQKFLFSTNIVPPGLLLLSLISCERSPETEVSADHKLIVKMPPFETTPSEIAWEYSNNSIAADNIFKNKVFNVKGNIVNVAKNSINEPYVSLRGGVNPDKEPQFAFIMSDREKAFELTAGQTVELQCKGLGELAGAPAAGECKIIK